MKKEIQEVNIIRPIIILLLVVMHSFTIYSGGWDKPDGILSVRSYFWIQKLSFAFMLEMFVFISGYVFAYQLYELKKKYSFKGLVVNKFKRLIIPSMIFSLLYMLLFDSVEGNMLQIGYKILNGMGHMWFLPMLFWCFIISWGLLKLPIKEEVKLLILFFVCVLSFIPLPFNMTNTLYYLFYFYLAVYIWVRKEKFVKKFVSLGKIVFLFVLFVVLFVPLTFFQEYMSSYSSETLLDKILFLMLLRLSRILYAIVGLLWFYSFVIYILKRGINVSSLLVKLNPSCFGIYIFHQFFLCFFYYKTDLPILLGTYWLPWVSCFLAILFSFLFTLLLRNYTLGRKILG